MQNEVCGIDVVHYEDAGPELRAIYDRVRGPDGCLDKLYQAFSLRPRTIEPANSLYLAVLHDEGNSLPKWFSELIGTYVAILTGCEYALAHHGRNFASLVADSERSERVLASLKSGRLGECGSESEVSVLRYVRKLCLEPESMSDKDLQALLDRGWSGGEILEIVQIVAMFSYFVRVINALGVSLKGERIGLYERP